MRYHSITAIVAAEITYSFKLRSRLVQLTPRAFHLLSRNRSISSTAQRSFKTTNHQRAQPAQPDPSSEASADKDNRSPNELPAESAVDKKNDGIGRKANETSGEALAAKKAEQQRALFIDVMRTVPHPVAIVTARRQDVEDDAQGTVAATVSSFNTVSIKPDLVVSFNLKADSTTFRTILDSNYFAITFPQMTAAGANLVHSFTRGNDPSPFTTEFPDHPTPRPSRWLAGRLVPPGLKYHPPAVSLTDMGNSKESGFAFAILCEYQTSTPIGDHVIVTGRISPRTFIKMADTGWGAMTSNNWIVSHQVTLAHVHGTYSNSDTGLGFANLMKLDDQSLGTQGHVTSLDSKITWCRERLRALAAAQMMQQGIQSGIVMPPQTGRNRVNTTQHAAKIQPELLQEYERYYMQRLQYLEYQAQKQPQNGVSSTLGEIDAESEEVADVPYRELLGHQQLFVRNKMLLSMEELDEEIALYTMRLTALRIKAKENPAAQALEEEKESTEELAPEESPSSIGLQPEEDGLSRNMQLRMYFLGRIYLLQHAKTRKIEFSNSDEKIKQPKEEKAAAAMMARFLGANKNESLSGLKNKYRRFHYQITEARLSLIGLEQMPGGHPNIAILKDRIKYFEPRLKVIEDLIKTRAQSASTKDLLIENFKVPTMRTPDTDESKKDPIYKTKRLRLEKVEPVLARQLIRPITTDVPNDREGESADHLDYSAEDYSMREEQSRAAIRQAASKLPIGIDPTKSVASRPSTGRPQRTPEEEAAEDLRQIREVERDLLRQNANQVRDYLVLKSSEGEEMPSPEDFVDANKIREETIRKKEENEKKAQ